MKTLVVPVILAVAVVLLGIWLYVTKDQAARQQQTDSATIVSLSNQLTTTSLTLGDREQSNVVLNLVISNREAELARFSNDLGQATLTLAGASNALDAAQQSIKATQEEVAKRDAKIAALETENQDLDKRANELTNAITSLNAQIADTRHKLATAEGDKAFLEKELQRLMAEKADLEKKFNDVAVLRAQVKQLKEDLAIARRIDWIRRGLWGSSEGKGAELLVQKAPPPSATASPSNRYDLNVEITSDGGVRVIPPLTNRPATNPPPGQ